MKTKLFSRVMVALASIMLMFSIASCGLGQLADIVNPDNYETGWTEEGNKLTYKQGLGLVTYILELTFNASGELVSAVETAVWSYAALAQEYYNQLKEEGAKNLKINGNTVTYNATEEFSGMNKDELKAFIENSYI